MFIVVFLLYVTVGAIYHYTKGVSNGTLYEERMKFALEASAPTDLQFLLIPIVLTVLIIRLKMKLKTKRRVMQTANFSNCFDQETKNLLIILIIFDCSLGFRVVFNFIIYLLYIKSSENGQVLELCTDSHQVQYMCFDPYPAALYDLITPYFWDFIPIMSILLFHKKNFSINKKLDIVNIRASQLDRSGHLVHLKSSTDSVLTNEDQIRATVMQSYLNKQNQSLLKNMDETAQELDRSIQVEVTGELTGDISELSNLSCQIEVH